MSSQKRPLDASDAADASEHDAAPKRHRQAEAKTVGLRVVSVKTTTGKRVRKGGGVIGPGLAFAHYEQWSQAPGSLYGGRRERIGAKPDPITKKKRVFVIDESPLCNPFPVGKSDKKDPKLKAQEEAELRKQSLDKFAAYADAKGLHQVFWQCIEAKLQAHPDLVEIQVGCWCKNLDNPLDCHCDVLVARAVKDHGDVCHCVV